jgi:hypothetical protein
MWCECGLQISINELIEKHCIGKSKIPYGIQLTLQCPNCGKISVYSEQKDFNSKV